MFTIFINACKAFFTHIKNQLKKITKPSTATIAAGVLKDLPRSKSDLIAENAILRQQAGETAATDNQRQNSTRVSFSLDPVLENSPSHYSTRHPFALASRPISSVLDAEIQV